MKSNLYNELKARYETRRATKVGVILGVVVIGYFLAHLIVYLIK